MNFIISSLHRQISAKNWGLRARVLIIHCSRQRPIISEFQLLWIVYDAKYYIFVLYDRNCHILTTLAITFLIRNPYRTRFPSKRQNTSFKNISVNKLFDRFCLSEIGLFWFKWINFDSKSLKIIARAKKNKKNPTSLEFQPEPWQALCKAWDIFSSHDFHQTMIANLMPLSKFLQICRRMSRLFCRDLFLWQRKIQFHLQKRLNS